MTTRITASVAVALVVQIAPGVAQERVVAGRVLAVTDSIPVAAVHLTIVGAALSALTDGDGRFALRGAPPGVLRLALAGSPIVPDTVTLPATQDSLTIYVRLALVRLPAVLVTGERTARERFDTEVQLSTVTVSPLEIRRTPALLEPDPIRVIQLLPGTVARNDFSIGYNVRGGENDQNLILIDGVPVFNPSHLGGIFSTFDANAIRSLDFLTGGFPAHYSGRLSSVLDVQLQDGDREGTDVRGHVSLLSSKAVVDGSVGAVQYMAGVRRTYADQVVRAFTPHEAPYYFTDAVSKLTFPAGRGSVSLTGFWSRDVLDLNLVDADTAREEPAIDLEFDWGNLLGGVTWRQPTGFGTFEHQVSLTTFSTRFAVVPDLVQYDNTADLFTARTSLALPRVGKHELRIGAGVERYDLRFTIRDPDVTLGFIDDPFLRSVFFNDRYRPVVWSAYVDDQWRVSDRLRLRPGVRVEHVTGANFTGIAPRVAFKAFLTPDEAVTGSVGRFYQAIHSLREQDLPISLFEYWIGADQSVPVGRSDHFVLGYERWVRDAWQVTVEGYRKTFDNLVVPNRAIALREEGEEFLPTEGDAWGVDLLVRRHAGDVRGWLAYSFLKATRRADGDVFPAAHDRRHTLDIVLFAPGPLGAEAGVRWGFGSGLPYTPTLGEWNHRSYSAALHSFTDARTELLPGDRNGARFPIYHRLDFGLRWRAAVFGGRLEPFLNVSNLYNRKNVLLYYFDFSTSPGRREGLSQLPLVPTFGLEFSW